MCMVSARCNVHPERETYRYKTFLKYCSRYFQNEEGGGIKKSKLKREKRRENKRGKFWGHRNGRRWTNHSPLHVLHLSPWICKWISEQTLSLTQISFHIIFVLPCIWIIALVKQKVWFPYFTCTYILSVAMLCTLIIWCWKHPFVFLPSEQHFFFPADPMTEKKLVQE